jgi:Rrf2 family protein
MSLLPRKNILTIAAVIDIALNAGDGPVSGKEVAARHHLPPRHLEPVLQALVREGILKGVRGPHGGYKLAREARRITAADILRAARTIDNGTETLIPGSSLVSLVVGPALAKAENEFSSALARLSVADLTAHALRRVAPGSRRYAVAARAGELL